MTSLPRVEQTAYSRIITGSPLSRWTSRLLQSPYYTCSSRRLNWQIGKCSKLPNFLRSWQDWRDMFRILFLSLDSTLNSLSMLLVLLLVCVMRAMGGNALSLSELKDNSCSSDNNPNPDTKRQILDIVWSCLAATLSCTWVSVHMNVPFRRESNWTNRRRRLWFMLLSIIAPDIVIMWAFIQMRGARDIRNSVNKLIHGLNESREEPQKSKNICSDRDWSNKCF